MKTGTKIAIGAISLIAVGTALYFLVFKKKVAVVTVQDNTGVAPAKDVMLEKIKSIFITPTESKESNDNFIAILNKMSDSELKDTYFMSIAFESGQKLSDALKKSMDDISKKYNIFT
jgi:hypothetical protein